MKWLRKWKCAMCGGGVVYDDIDYSLRCKCGVAYQQLPKGFVLLNFDVAEKKRCKV